MANPGGGNVGGPEVHRHVQPARNANADVPASWGRRRRRERLCDDGRRHRSEVPGPQQAAVRDELESVMRRKKRTVIDENAKSALALKTSKNPKRKLKIASFSAPKSASAGLRLPPLNKNLSLSTGSVVQVRIEPQSNCMGIS